MENEILLTAERDLLANGWAVVSLPDSSIIKSIQDTFLSALQAQGMPRLPSLQLYHEHVKSREHHTQCQQSLTDIFWQHHYGDQIIASQLSFFRQFIGIDLMIQNYPYVRLARPGKEEDNIGYHRDTHHGSSPYEVSCFVPFVDLDEQSALQFIPGSHKEPESAYPWSQTQSPDVERGSAKHKLGFPYAPKKLLGDIKDRMKPVPVQAGQMIIFSLATVHGQEVNNSTKTRISADIRLVNALAPVTTSRGVQDQYYKPLCTSAMRQQAEYFLEANQTDNPATANSR